MAMKLFESRSWSPRGPAGGHHEFPGIAPELKLESARHHADDEIVLAVDPYRPADDAAVRPVPPLPTGRD